MTENHHSAECSLRVAYAVEACLGLFRHSFLKVNKACQTTYDTIQIVVLVAKKIQES